MTDVASTPTRLRDVHLIPDGIGGSGFLYDLERTLVLEVPEQFRRIIAPALQLGAPPAALVGWLEEEDLLTSAPRRSWAQGARPPLPRVTDISMDLSGACNMGCVYCFENDINSRVGPMSSEAVDRTLEFAFRTAVGAPRLVFHFGSGEPLLQFESLKRVVEQALQRAEVTGQAVTFELTTNGTRVTPEIARFLRDYPFNVRVSCDGPASIHNPMRPLLGGQASYPAVLNGLKLLLEYLPDRLTVNSVISGSTRLWDVWGWAKELGLRHYHVIKVGAFQARQDLHLEEVEQFRADLQRICEDIFDDLEAGRAPIDYQPITKVIRRLMIPQPVTRFCGVAGSYLGVSATGKVYPCFRHLGLEQYEFGDVVNGVSDLKRQQFLGSEAADVDTRPICSECWGRYLCGGGCYADSTVYGPDKLKPQVQHCPFWLAEFETAIRFYRRLVAADPTYCILLFGDDPDTLLEQLEDMPQFLAPKNCG